MIVAMLAVATHDSVLASIWYRWSPVVSLAVAALAMITTLSQARSAKKALHLSLLQDARRTARLDLSLRDSALWTIPGAGRRFVGVRVLVVNPADSSATLTHAELNLSYEVAPERILTVKIPVAENTDSISEMQSALVLPIPLPGSGAVEGWLIFGFDCDLVGDRPIRGYDIIVNDSRGVAASVQPWVMREITFGQEL